MKAGFVFFVLQERSWEVFWAFLSAVIGQSMKGWQFLILYLILEKGQNTVYGKSVLSDESKDEAFVYLTQFGYIENDAENSDLVTDKVITNAVKDFQVCITIQLLLSS